MNTPLVLLLTGSRSLPDPCIVGTELAKLTIGLGDRHLLVRHGACPGPNSADQAASAWITACGKWLGVTEDPHPADWDHCAPTCPASTNHRRWKKRNDIYHPGNLLTYCPGAGPRRNRHMTGLSADLCLAFPDPEGPSHGTRGCMRLAKAAGIQVREVSS